MANTKLIGSEVKRSKVHAVSPSCWKVYNTTSVKLFQRLKKYTRMNRSQPTNYNWPQGRYTSKLKRDTADGISAKEQIIHTSAHIRTLQPFSVIFPSSCFPALTFHLSSVFQEASHHIAAALSAKCIELDSMHDNLHPRAIATDSSC